MTGTSRPKRTETFQTSAGDARFSRNATAFAEGRLTHCRLTTGGFRSMVEKHIMGDRLSISGHPRWTLIAMKGQPGADAIAKDAILRFRCSRSGSQPARRP